LKIITILGARPQFIKAAMVSRKLEKNPAAEEIIIHTGQHFDSRMSKVFFDEMNLPQPKFNLGINQMAHGAMTGNMLEEIEDILLDIKPQLVLVYGDTNSTLAGALAAAKLNIPVAHVEAGLRSFNRRMPEEINRVLTDHVSSLLFCPTDNAVKNLEQEGIVSKKGVNIVRCGDIMFDAFLEYNNNDKYQPSHISNSPFVLATIHRQENTDDKEKLESIINALNEINEQKKVIMPLHPRTNEKISDYQLKPEFTIIPPSGYISMLGLLTKCDLVITDSGGLQKEAYFAKKLCLTIRSETEWVELVNGGFNVLSNSDSGDIISAFKILINKSSDFKGQLYGDGKAGEKIVNSILEYHE